MEEIINTDRITLEYNTNSKEYRLSLFDKYYHYTDEIILTSEQLYDLLSNGKDIEIKCEEDNL